MTHLDPIAYTYEADYHCPACAFARFGQDEHGSVPESAEDSEGNPIGAVAPWDEWWEASDWRGETLNCSDCGVELDSVDANPPQPFVASVTEAYLDCAAWADAPRGEDGEEEDSSGWADEVYAEAEEDVRSFLTDCSRDIPEDMSAETIGHNLWLTRNGHGAGFWDLGPNLFDLRPLVGAAMQQRLTDAANALGEVWVYVGDDSRLYLSQ